jgi:ankyrin repeat protein
MYLCHGDFEAACRWLDQNANTLDQIPNLEVPHRTCCAQFTPLDMAIMDRRPDIVEKLIVLGANAENLEHRLVYPRGRNWDFEDIFRLCYLGERNRGKTPTFLIMHTAIYNQKPNPGRLEWLLEHGGDPNGSMVWSDGPPVLFYKPLLDLAITMQQVECAELLLCYGAVIRPEMMPYALRIGKRATEMVRVLLAAGQTIDVHSRDARGETLFWKACSGSFPKEGRAALLTLLLEHGADINVAAIDTGTTPLMFAAAYGDREVISLLLGAGADPLARDRQGRTAYDFAQMRGRDKAAELLLAANNFEEV